jgi:hypothetical protein
LSGHSPVERDVKNIVKIKLNRSQSGRIDEAKPVRIRPRFLFPYERQDSVDYPFIKDAARFPEKETQL